MVDTRESANEITEQFDRHFEWLAVFDDDEIVPLRRDEMEVAVEKEKIVLLTYGNSGHISKRITSYSISEEQVELTVSGSFGRDVSTILFIPRESALLLKQQVDHARLERAAKAAATLFDLESGYKIRSISLSQDNARLSHLFAISPLGEHLAAVFDVTGDVPHRSLLAAAIKLNDRLAARKNHPIYDLIIAGLRPQMRRLKKLVALLKPNVAARFQFFEIEDDGENLNAKPLRQTAFNELWRTSVKRKYGSELIMPSKTATEIVAMASEKIDVVNTANGETLRFYGLPFARVRRIAGEEQCWFGIGNKRKLLNDTTREEFYGLVDELHRRRDKETPEKRHELYSTAAESWIGSILRRDITKLDANLILSPIYDQFQTTSGKLDLLAMRRNGQLVVIEIKAQPDRNAVFQSIEYWQKVELLRRKGVLQDAGLFGAREILDRPSLLYIVAPALSFHHDFDRFASAVRSEIDIWRWELHQDWRSEIKAIARKDYS